MIGKVKGQLDHIDQLKRIRDQITNPLSKKYIDKALEHNAPVVDGDHSKSEVSDINTFHNYEYVFKDIKKYVEIGNSSNDLIKKIYEKQIKLKAAFNRLSIANQNLLPYLRPDQKQIILNEESKAMLSKIQESYEEIKALIEEIKKATEQAFDKIHGVVL